MPDYIFCFGYAVVSAIFGLITFEALPAVAFFWLLQMLVLTGIGLWQLHKEDSR